MTIWSLTSRSVAYVPHPKSCDVSFTPDGSFLAVVERKVLRPLVQLSPRAALNRVVSFPQDCVDFLSIFCNATGWVLAKRTQLPTRDCCGCAWSPDGSMIAVWDCVLECRSPLCLAAIDAQFASALPRVTLFCSVIVYSPDGRIMCNFKPYPASSGLGITSVSWSPTSQFLAVGCHNSKLYVLNTLTFKPTWDTAHEAAASSSTVIYRCAPAVP
jgi:WD40 repeat protein